MLWPLVGLALAVVVEGVGFAALDAWEAIVEESDWWENALTVLLFLGVMAGLLVLVVFVVKFMLAE